MKRKMNRKMPKKHLSKKVKKNRSKKQTRKRMRKHRGGGMGDSCVNKCVESCSRPSVLKRLSSFIFPSADNQPFSKKNPLPSKEPAQPAQPAQPVIKIPPPPPERMITGPLEHLDTTGNLNALDETNLFLEKENQKKSKGIMSSIIDFFKPKPKPNNN